MRNEVDLRRKSFGTIPIIVIMRYKFRAGNDFLNKSFEAFLGFNEALAPIVGEWINRHRLVRMLSQVVSKFLDQFTVANRKHLISDDSRGFVYFVTCVIWVLSDAVEFLNG